MNKVKKTIYGFLRGSFLVNENSFRMQIAKLNKEIKEVRAEFVDTRSIAMRTKLESTIKKSVENIGLKPSETPPQVIKVVKNKVN